MLVLSRKLNESIIVDGNIRITIVGIRGNHVRVGIEAPDSVPIIREELCDRLVGEVSVMPLAREESGHGLGSRRPT
jgi:carbon storage regulator